MLNSVQIVARGFQVALVLNGWSGAIADFRLWGKYCLGMLDLWLVRFTKAGWISGHHGAMSNRAVDVRVTLFARERKGLRSSALRQSKITDAVTWIKSSKIRWTGHGTGFITEVNCWSSAGGDWISRKGHGHERVSRTSSWKSWVKDAPRALRARYPTEERVETLMVHVVIWTPLKATELHVVTTTIACKNRIAHPNCKHGNKVFDTMGRIIRVVCCVC